MYSSDQLDPLLQEALAKLGMQDEGNDEPNKKKKCINLTAPQALVIAGLLSGALNVFSVLVDANQEINIVLTGSLKKKDSNDNLDKIMAQIGTMPFDEVVAAMIRRLRS